MISASALEIMVTIALVIAAAGPFVLIYLAIKDIRNGKLW